MTNFPGAGHSARGGWYRRGRRAGVVHQCFRPYRRWHRTRVRFPGSAGEICLGVGMPHPHVVVERSHAGFLLLLLSRPERRNAFDPEMVGALTEAMKAEDDAVVVLGSTDPQVFCAGADLTIPVAQRAVVSDLLYECLEHIITRPGPVIAALGGAAVGGGAQLATAADMRIVGPEARLRWIGPPGAGLAVGAWILPDLVGRGAALELTMTGRWVGAAAEDQEDHVGRRPGRPAASRAAGEPGGLGSDDRRGH